MRLALLFLLFVPLAAHAQTPPTADTLAARWTRAIDTDDLAAVDALLIWGDGGDLPGDPPIYRAAQQGRTAIVRRLLAANVPADTPSVVRGNVTPLHAALYYRHAETAQVLLDAGADIRRRSSIGFAAFDWALEVGDGDGMEVVLARFERQTDGADALAFALARAALAGDAERTRALIARGADPNATNDARYPALTLAARLDHPEIIAALLQAGADYDMGRIELDEASPLHQAARGGSLASARLLLRAGADPNKLNARGFTALHLAALYNRPAVAGLLLASGTDIAVRSVDPDPGIGEYTAFDFAVEQDRPVVADTLLAWVQARTSNPMTEQLARAAVAGDAAAIRRLVDDGADANAPSVLGTTPLSLAARWDHEDAVRALLAAGADPNRASPDRYGMTPLMHAARADNATVALLLAAGADANARDRYGSTALHWAAAQDAAGAADLLLMAGADRTVLGLNRLTASELASSRGFIDLARRLGPEN